MAGGPALSTDKASDVVGRYGLIVLLTTNESFGWLIVEVIVEACSVLSSDQEPV